MLFIPDFEEVRNEFQIKNTEKYRKQSQAKLSSMDLLNGFILDGIIGNYKQAELPLMHQNLENIQELITPEKSIFIFEDINQTHIIRKLKKYAKSHKRNNKKIHEKTNFIPAHNHQTKM